jgi:hypothetical protein
MAGTAVIMAIAILYILGSLRVLRQYERGVVFLLGKFAGVRGPGLTLIFLPFQQMVRTSLRTVTMQIPSQKIITKDNVSIDIAAVAYYHVTDPESSVIAIENVYNAINQISQTTVRNVVGRFSLDELLSNTSGINEQIKNVIDQHTEPWDTQVTAVEIKDIELPENMQRAMAKEAEAERERRAKIVAAEGEYQAAVKLGQAADIITQHPVALQLRTLQTMAEISVEKNSTIIFPAQFSTTVQDAIALMAKETARNRLAPSKKKSAVVAGIVSADILLARKRQTSLSPSGIAPTEKSSSRNRDAQVNHRDPVCISTAHRLINKYRTKRISSSRR